MGNSLQNLRPTEAQVGMQPGFQQIQAAQGIDPSIPGGQAPMGFSAKPAYIGAGFDMAGDQPLRGNTPPGSGQNTDIRQKLAQLLSMRKRGF